MLRTLLVAVSAGAEKEMVTGLGRLVSSDPTRKF